MPNTAETNERLFCWEQVQATNPLFRISRVFAVAVQTERLLPLYALFAALEQLCSQRVDLDVARRTLDWWRSECQPGNIERSGHPILRELTRAGACTALNRGALARLFDTVEARLDAGAPADLDGLGRLCQFVAEPQYDLELGLCAGLGSLERQAPTTCASNGLAQLIRESVGSSRAGRYWWLPLHLLARHGVSRADVRELADAPAVRALFEDILGRAQGWAGMPGGQQEHARIVLAPMRHFVVFSHLQACILRRLRESRPAQYPVVLKRAGAAELFQAWKAARLVSRP
jgi:phytoene/squalene synthetase